MPRKSPRQRFIAGAVCPRCGLPDKIVVDLESDQRRCVSCGFAEGRPGQQPGETVSHPVEPPTRVSRAAARRVETPAEPITLVDPAADNRKPGG